MGFKPDVSFVMWSSPLIVAVGCTLASVFALMRSQFHIQELRYIEGELKSVILCVCFAFVYLWVAANLAAKDLGIAQVVLRLAVASLFGIFYYLFCSFGTDRIIMEAEKNAWIQQSHKTLHGDWAKGLGLVFAWPLLPAYFFVEWCHQKIRTWRTEPEWLAEEARNRDFPDPPWLTREARPFWVNVIGCEWASVLTKAMYGGILIFGIQVTSGTVLPLLLSFLNAGIASWPSSVCYGRSG